MNRPQESNSSAHIWILTYRNGLAMVWDRVLLVDPISSPIEPDELAWLSNFHPDGQVSLLPIALELCFVVICVCSLSFQRWVGHRSSTAVRGLFECDRY